MPLNLRTISVTLGVTAVVLLLDWLYVNYLLAHGFNLKSYEFILGTLRIDVPLQWLPVFGILLVSIIVWSEVNSTIFPRRAGPETDLTSNFRLVRVIVMSLAAFVCVLYIPYIIGSSWFWSRMSSASSVSQIHGFALSLLNTDQSVMELAPLWQYAISQVSAVIAMLLTAFVFGRVARRVRR